MGQVQCMTWEKPKQPSASRREKDEALTTRGREKMKTEAETGTFSVSCAECKVADLFGRMVKEVKKCGVVCCIYTRKRNLGKVDFVQTQPIFCCRWKFSMSSLSYLTILDLDSASNSYHSKLVSLGYSINSTQTCLPVITTLTHSCGWILISSGWSLCRPAEAYFIRLKLISSGWSLFHPAEAYIVLLKPTSSGWSLSRPAEAYVVRLKLISSCWSLILSAWSLSRPAEASFHPVEAYLVRLKLISSGWSLSRPTEASFYPAEAYLVRLKLISSGWSLFRPVEACFIRLKFISSGWSLSRPVEAYFIQLQSISSGWSLYPLRRDTSHASAGRDPAGPYIVTDVCRDNPHNINNYEPLLYEAHYCMVLLLQQCGLVLVNLCVLKF